MFILLTLRKTDIDSIELNIAIWEKAVERNSTIYIENYEKYLNDIYESKDMQGIWNSYKNKYHYALDIDFNSIIDVLRRAMQ